MPTCRVQVTFKVPYEFLVKKNLEMVVGDAIEPFCGTIDGMCNYLLKKIEVVF